MFTWITHKRDARLLRRYRDGGFDQLRPAEQQRVHRLYDAALLRLIGQRYGRGFCGCSAEQLELF